MKCTISELCHDESFEWDCSGGNAFSRAAKEIYLINKIP